MSLTSQANGRDFRMGIRVGGLRSRCWRVRSGARKPEVFIEREGLEEVAHVSLHMSKEWHLKVRGKKQHQWLRPEDVHPGYTRAAILLQPPAVAFLHAQAPLGATLVDLGDGDTTAQFQIFLEAPGANMATWPSKDALGTELLARLPLAAGAGTVCVVLLRAAIPAGKAVFDREPTLAGLELDTQSGARFTTLIGGESDGALTLLDLRADSLDAAVKAGSEADEQP